MNVHSWCNFTYIENIYNDYVFLDYKHSEHIRYYELLF